MAEPFFNLCVFSPELVKDLHDEMILQALSLHEKKVEADVDWKKAIKSYLDDTEYLSRVWISTGYAPVDVPVGHNFSRIFQRDSTSDSYSISASVLHIIWHFVNIPVPVPVAGHGHRHFFVFDEKTFKHEVFSKLPQLQQWEQIGYIDEQWCMI